MGCLPSTKSFQKDWLESKWHKTFKVVCARNGKSEKVVLFFKTECFKTEIRVP